MILLAVPVLAGALLLVVAGLEHIRDPQGLARAAGTGRPAARLIALVELLIGVPALAALLLGLPPLRWALAAQSLIYLIFAAHLMLRRHRGDESDCGCNRMSTRVGPGGIARAWVLAAVSVAAAAVHPAAALAAFGAGGIALAIVGSIVMATLLYALPAAVDGRAVQSGTS